MVAVFLGVDFIRVSAGVFSNFIVISLFNSDLG